MTSLLPGEGKEKEEEKTSAKQKSQAHVTCGMVKSAASDEARSFLSFSRENLSISNSELEQGFRQRTKRHRLGLGLGLGLGDALRRCGRHHQSQLLSLVALLLALSCAGLELWKLGRVLANSREIEIVKRDVEAVKRRFLEKDLLDELRAFEEQLYGKGASEEAEQPSSDYDSSYGDDDDDDSSGDYSGSASNAIATSSPNGVPPSSTTTTKTTTPKTTTTGPCASRELEDALAALRRAEARARNRTRGGGERDDETRGSGQPSSSTATLK